MKPKKIYQLSDLNQEDFELLTKAYTLEDKEFLCLGRKSHYKLTSLGLMSDELQITFQGRHLIWDKQQETKAKK